MTTRGGASSERAIDEMAPNMIERFAAPVVSNQNYYEELTTG